jgi:hypothetical protein
MESASRSLLNRKRFFCSALRWFTKNTCSNPLYGDVPCIDKFEYPYMSTHTLKFGIPPTTLDRYRSLLKIRNLICALRRPAPPDYTIRVDTKRARRLPATPTLSRSIPNPLLPSQLPDLIKPTRAQYVPKTRYTQSPRAISKLSGSLPACGKLASQVSVAAGDEWETATKEISR